MKNTLPRGLRNNNPLNIRKNPNTHWQGQKTEQTDKAFVQFISLAYGFRAAFKTIRTYMTKYGCKNITQIIMRWAPPSENHTSAYIAKVSEMSGIHPLEPIDFNNGAMMKKIVQAMAYVENGVIVDGDSIEKGYQLAIKN